MCRLQCWHGEVFIAERVSLFGGVASYGEWRRPINRPCPVGAPATMKEGGALRLSEEHFFPFPLLFSEGNRAGYRRMHAGYGGVEVRGQIGLMSILCKEGG